MAVINFIILNMKKLTICAAFLLAAGSLSAQSGNSTVVIEETGDKYRVETNRFWSNWFFTVGGGAQMYFGDHDRQMSFGKRLSPSVDVGVGKWFTPGIGVRVMYTGLSAKGATQNGVHSTGKVYDASKWLSYSKFNYGNAHADVLFNLSNILCGYNPDRVYSATPYFGLGWMFTWDSPRQQEVSANLGLLNTFRLSSALDLNVDVRGSMVNDRFDGEVGGTKREGVLSATVGLTYKFKQRGWKRSQTKTVVYNNEEDLSAIRERLNETQKRLRETSDENYRLKTELADAVKPIEGKVFIPKLIVVFPLGKSTLNKESRVNLGFLAEAILKNEGASYVITGYADNSTGTPEINERLSRERAQAVADCLTREFKVPASVLTVDGMGGVGDMFYNDAALSRAVITEVYDED